MTYMRCEGRYRLSEFYNRHVHDVADAGKGGEVFEMFFVFGIFCFSEGDSVSQITLSLLTPKDRNLNRPRSRRWRLKRLLILVPKIPTPTTAAKVKPSMDKVCAALKKV